MKIISKNRYILFLILGIVAMALMVPSIYSAVDRVKYFSSEESEYFTYYCFQLVEYICIFMAELVFVIIGLRKQMTEPIVMTAAILYYASSITFKIYDVIQTSNYRYVFDIAIEILCLVTVVLALSKPSFLLSAIILLLIDSAFNLANTFSGSTFGLSSLILSVMLIFVVYFCCAKPDKDDLDSNIYS